MSDEMLRVGDRVTVGARLGTVTDAGGLMGRGWPIVTVRLDNGDTVGCYRGKGQVHLAPKGDGGRKT